MSITYHNDITSSRPAHLTTDAEREANAAHYAETGEYAKGIRCIEHVAGVPYFVGQVVAVESRTVRVWGEYESLRYAVVADGNGGFAEHGLGYAHMNGRSGKATVDATPALRAAYSAKIHAEAVEAEREAAQYAAERQAREEAARQEEAKRDLLGGFGRGDRVVVYKGRKVPKGTEGVIIWEGSGSYGPRVGVKDDAGTVHWTARSNCERADADALAIDANGDWSDLTRRIEAKKIAANAKARDAAPRKGARVKTACGHTGKVFWVAGDGSRLGVKIGRGREDVVWAAANSVKLAA